MKALDEESWRLLFLDARTHGAWLDRPVEDAVLRQLYELVRMGPTGLNSQPVRLVFVKSPQAKERLRPALDPGNVDQAMRAPVTVIVAYDAQFHEKLGTLAPHLPALVQRIGAMESTARQRMAQLSATLQGGFLIIAARGLGLDCGPMGGFDKAKVDADFFPDGNWKSLFLLNLGHGDATALHPRAPRLEFQDVCRVD